MAVFSIVTTSSLDSTRRIDAEYYRSEYLIQEKLIRRVPHNPLSKYGDFITGPFGSEFKVENYVKNSNCRYVRGKDVKPFQIADDDNVYIPGNDYERLEKYSLRNGDILVSVVGTLGNAAIVIHESLPAVFSCKSTAFRSKKIDPYYLITYLNCKYGHNFLVRRARGTVQTGLNIDDLRTLPIFEPNERFVSLISNRTEQSLSSLENSSQVYIQAEQLLLSELGLKDWKPRHTLTYVRNYSQAARARRMDAEHFQPKYAELRAHIRNYPNGYFKITDIARNSDETAEPRAHPEMDFDYIELADINQVTGTIKSANAIKGKDAPSRARMVLRSGDVIASTVEGSLDKVALVSQDYDGTIGSTGFFVLRPRTVASGYLLALTKSIVVREQMRCESSGTILAAVPAKSLRNIIIPNIPPNKRDEISALVRQSHAARREAKALLEKAKRAVEIAIEENEERAVEFIG